MAGANNFVFTNNFCIKTDLSFSDLTVFYPYLAGLVLLVLTLFNLTKFSLTIFQPYNQEYFKQIAKKYVNLAILILADVIYEKPLITKGGQTHFSY